MIARFQSPVNIDLLKNIVNNYITFYTSGVLFTVIILILIKISYKLFHIIKLNIFNPKFLNFYIYKLLVLAGAVFISRIFTSIIFFVYNRTIKLLLDLII